MIFLTACAAWCAAVQLDPSCVAVQDRVARERVGKAPPEIREKYGQAIETLARETDIARREGGSKAQAFETLTREAPQAVLRDNPDLARTYGDLDRRYKELQERGGSTEAIKQWQSEWNEFQSRYARTIWQGGGMLDRGAADALRFQVDRFNRLERKQLDVVYALEPVRASEKKELESSLTQAKLTPAQVAEGAKGRSATADLCRMAALSKQLTDRLPLSAGLGTDTVKYEADEIWKGGEGDAVMSCLNPIKAAVRSVQRQEYMAPLQENHLERYLPPPTVRKEWKDGKGGGRQTQNEGREALAEILNDATQADRTRRILKEELERAKVVPPPPKPGPNEKKETLNGLDDLAKRVLRRVHGR